MRWIFASIGAVLIVALVGGGIWLAMAPGKSPPAARSEAAAPAAKPAASDKPAADKSAAADKKTAEAKPDANADKQATENVIDGTGGADTLKGTDGADRITGGAGNDRIDGLGGNDRIYAASETDAEGADIIAGGDGDDRIYADPSDTVNGGAGHDQLLVRGKAGMTVDLAATSIEEPWGGPGDDVFDGSAVTSEDLALRGGPGADRLTGGGGKDRLYGGDGDDTLVGGAGDDMLRGEAGVDTLTGGPGADTFYVEAYDGSTDIVTDYNAAEGDVVTGGSFQVVDGDTLILDKDRKILFRLVGYDASKKGVQGR
jgi:Ca2+-binding RTX toxin-like protein